MYRRTVLSISGISSLTGTSGCLSSVPFLGSEKDESIHLCRLEVANWDSSAHHVSLRIMDGETEIYARDEEVDGRTETRLGGYSISSEELPDDLGRYRIRARLNDGEWRDSYLPDVAQGQEQVAVYAMIESERDGDHLSFVYSTDPNTCTR